jgi:MTH538 TIR-like domain (DUF1863)
MIEAKSVSQLHFVIYTSIVHPNSRAKRRDSDATEGPLASLEEVVGDKKVVFIAFAIEDETQRDFLKGQSLHPRAPYEFIDMSVKEPYDRNWKERVRARIKRSDGVIALVSKNSLKSSGQQWEITCAKEEKKRIRGIYAYSSDRTNVEGVNTFVWSDDNISDFIDSL